MRQKDRESIIKEEFVSSISEGSEEKTCAVTGSRKLRWSLGVEREGGVVGWGFVQEP